VHCDIDGHDTELRYWPGSSTCTPAPFAAPELGSNVTSFPPWSTAVHCDPDGQDTELRDWPGSSTWTPAPFAAPEPGSNITSLPPWSTAVHCDPDGHDNELRAGDAVRSSEYGPAQEN
jgi:hypothetical protein